MNGINFTYAGKGVISSNTCYYRAHSAVRELKEGDFDWEGIFGEDGVRMFNSGGIFTLISPASLNYRAKVEPNKQKARQINQKIAPFLGFLVGNDSDLSDALGYETKVAKGSLFDEWLAAYKRTVEQVASDFPNLSLIGTQWRKAINADLISRGAVLYDTIAKKFCVAALRKNIPIRDRTGGGDSFLSGVLAALLKGKDLQTAVEWGAAHGILVQETPGDTTMVDERMVEAEVKRALKGGGVKASR